MIDGVKIIDLKKITDERGMIFHMLKNTDEHFQKFGEIYFSTIFEDKIKAWHLHKEATLNYVCVYGKVKLVLFDERKTSETFGEYQEIFLSPENYFLITIPPNIWNGFTSADQNLAVLANCSDIPHDKTEISRLNFDDPKFPYNWNKN